MHHCESNSRLDLHLHLHLSTKVLYEKVKIVRNSQSFTNLDRVDQGLARVSQRLDTINVRPRLLAIANTSPCKLVHAVDHCI